MAQLATIQFHDQTIFAIEHDGKHFVAMKPIVENIGLNWDAQRQRIKRHPVLSGGAVVMNVPSSSGDQDTTFLPVDMLNGWLFGVDVNRVRPELRERLMQYQRECFQVLNAHFNRQPMPNLYKQNPGDKLNSYQQQQLRGLLEEFVKHLPKDKQAGFMMQGWSKLKSHFGVAYREIPCERFDEAVSLLTRHVVEHAKPQPIEAQPGRIRVSPQTLIENAAHIAGQLFGEALKQGALGGSPIDRFVVTADYKGGRCNMEVIERDAYILPIPRLAEVIRSHEPIALSEVAALMGACAEKLARHHAPRLAA